MKEVFVHIGFGKTATTTLQNHFFANHSEIECIGRPYERGCPTRKLIYDMCYQDTTIYNPESLRKFVDEHRDSDKAVLFSDENILGYVPIRGCKDTKITCERLQQGFGPCKIIIGIRGQISLMRSYYTYGGNRLKGVPKYQGRIIPFNKWYDFHFRDYLDGGWFSTIHFYEIIKYYESVFGRENIHVCLFEEFVRDQKSFMEKLCGFMDIDADEALALVADKHSNKTQKGLPAYQLYGRTPKGYFWRLWNKKSRKEVSLTKGQEKELINTYGPGNRKLAGEFGLNLEKYGYPLK